jgi:S1-C subfamily serine protease
LKRKALYSRATRKRALEGTRRADSPVAISYEWEAQRPSLFAKYLTNLKKFYARHDRLLSSMAAVLVTLAILGGWSFFHPAPTPLTQWDIDNAVHYTMANTPPGPAETTVAAATVAPSVVRVDGYLSPEHAAQIAKDEADAERKLNHGKAPPPKVTPPKPSAPQGADGTEDHPDSTGSGVVIDEQGSILTNLHVIRSTDRWVVTFADGSKSEATVQSVQPQDDLAVIRAKKAPDELKPATLASTRDLNPGDTVVAVGFPFGIGPSVSSGVVAGLKREFDDPDRKPEDGGKMTNLIQFDAAVNPGNSGGPLVNRDGEVVGIVTALYNPTGQHVFAGMGFAVPIENAARAVGQNPF